MCEIDVSDEFRAHAVSNVRNAQDKLPLTWANRTWKIGWSSVCHREGKRSFISAAPSSKSFTIEQTQIDSSVFVSLCVRALDSYASDTLGHIKGEFYIGLTISIGYGFVQNQIRMNLLSVAEIGVQETRPATAREVMARLGITLRRH